ncbi:MAG: VOC family protein [Candidatus Dormiibacterota bacterium]
MLATTDLSHGEDQLWRGYGLRAAPGGRHVAWGTANMIIPVGEQYLELVAVTNPELAAASLLGRAVLAAADRDRVTPIAVCLLASDLEPISRRLGTPAETGGRERPDGSQIRWRTVGLERAFGAARLPFYISWEDPLQHPSTIPAEHRIDAREISEVEVGGPEPILAGHLAEPVTAIRPVGGAAGLRSVTLRLADGTEVLIA